MDKVVANNKRNIMSEKRQFQYSKLSLFRDIIFEIEFGLKNGISVDNLAIKYNVSTGHLRRWFRHIYNQTIGEYIRTRKLSASLVDLINKNVTIIEIALDYGFDYEASYIRSFKREFGITPGKYRKDNRKKCG